jgi:hypothetical protein
VLSLALYYVNGPLHVTYTLKQWRLTTKKVLSADICSHLHSALFVFNQQFVSHPMFWKHNFCRLKKEKKGEKEKKNLLQRRCSHDTGQRQETLDLPYLTLLCDNLKNRMFLQNFFSWPYFGNVLYCSSYPHHSTIPQPNNFIRDCRIRLLGQKRTYHTILKLADPAKWYGMSSCDLWGRS